MTTGQGVTYDVAERVVRWLLLNSIPSANSIHKSFSSYRRTPPLTYPGLSFWFHELCFPCLLIFDQFFFFLENISKTQINYVTNFLDSLT